MRGATRSADQVSKPAVDWFLYSSSLYKQLNDPAKLAASTMAVLPPEVARALVAYSELGLSGSITIHFAEGIVKSCDQQSSHGRFHHHEGKRSA